jgi:cell division transport system permease protein
MKGWLLHHRQAGSQALRRLASTPLNTLLGALVLGIALALPAGGQMLLANFQRLAQRIAATPQISVFMALDAAKSDVAEVESRLRKHALTREVRLVQREDTLKRFKENEGLAEVIESLPRNPFPDAFVVVPRDEVPAALEAMRETFAKYPRVEHVQLDSAWVKKLDALLRLAHLAVTLLAAVLGVALVAVTFNTIRLQVLTQREEMEVSRLLGATDAYIRRPFLYFGALQGLAGGCVAWLAVLGATFLLRGPVGEVAGLYGIEFSLHILPLPETALLFGLAALLGWLGAWLSLDRNL